MIHASIGKLNHQKINLKTVSMLNYGQFLTSVDVNRWVHITCISVMEWRHERKRHAMASFLSCL